MVHDLSPFLLRISGDFGIRWYGLSYMAGFICAYFLFTWLAKRQKAGLDARMVSDFVTYAAIGTLVGGRLGYVFFYGIDLLWKFKASFPFWGVLAVNEGGMASHGGIIGVVAACFIFTRKYGVNTLYLFDLCSLAGPVGIFFGRIANFINGELVGRECDPNFPLAVKFPQDMYSWPNEAFSKIGEITSVVEKVGVSKDQWLEWFDKYRLDPMARNQVYDTFNKIIEAIQSGNSEVKNELAPFLVPRHPSQLYAAFSEGLLLFLILFMMWRKPRKPGVIGATFVICYAFVRIVDEIFRMPDAHIGFQWLGLTRGQWLSIAMIFVGFVLMFFWQKTGAVRINGWSLGENIKIGRRI